MTPLIILASGALLLFTGVRYVVAARPPINQWGAADQEHQATWPGDQFVTRPGFVWTNALTIQAPAAQVWPWLVQLGQGRGGLTSYDWLENLIACDVDSTDRILPQFQTPLRAGDRLQSIDQHATRLLVRCRGSSLMARLQGPVQFVMQRKMMLGIRQRAEGASLPSPPAVDPCGCAARPGAAAGPEPQWLRRPTTWRQPRRCWLPTGPRRPWSARHRSTEEV